MVSKFFHRLFILYAPRGSRVKHLSLYCAKFVLNSPPYELCARFIRQNDGCIIITPMWVHSETSLPILSYIWAKFTPLANYALDFYPKMMVVLS